MFWAGMEALLHLHQLGLEAYEFEEEACLRTERLRMRSSVAF